MKTIFRLVTALGFVLMIGAAGGADMSNVSFVNTLLLEICGMLLVILGYSALCHYKRYLRRRMRSRKINIKSTEKELSLT